jgi:CheY-like chemotaxis protein
MNPQEDPVARPGTRSSSFGQPTRPGHKPTVLVVDDDAALRSLASQVLHSNGFHVLAAGDVAEATEVSDHHDAPIDLLLTDIVLPSGNGITLARTILAKRPMTPVLYMSGYQPDVIRAVQDGEGPDGGFIEKPFLPHVLIEQVRLIVPAPQQHKRVFTQAAQAAQLPSPEPAGQYQSTEAVYRLEAPVRCPQCGEAVSSLRAVRLLRVHVNFTSTLPRRGRVMVCPNCMTIVPAELTNF